MGFRNNLLTFYREMNELRTEAVRLHRFNNRSNRMIWFTGEKVFTVSPLRNSQNNRLYDSVRKGAIDPERLLTERI